MREWVATLSDGPADLDDAARVDVIRALEDLKAAASATQAWVSVAFDASQRAAQRDAGVPGDLLGRGIGAQVALARRESPHAGGRILGFARALVEEMPHTLAALSSGVLSEWRATLLVRESACLSREDRGEFDRLLAADPRALVGVGTRALVTRARTVSQRLDVAAVVARARRAASERCVTLRPAPDTMTYLTALLPVAQGVGVYAALTRAADAARAAGDPRGRGQVMADELVRRIATDDRPVLRLQVQLVMTDRTLLAGDDEPAFIPGYGTVPGPWARDLVADALTGDGDHGGITAGRGADGRDPHGRAQVWVRRLFTAPASGQLVAMDSRARLAPAALAELIRARDGGACRTPYCDAPIRHIDHVRPSAEGGATSAANLQGLCEGCNYAKQAPGWHQSVAPPVAASHPPSLDAGGGVVAPDVQITTPTGHRYISRAPALPGAGPPRQDDVQVDAGPPSAHVPIEVEHARAPGTGEASAAA